MKRFNVLILLLSISIITILTESCKKDESCPTINCNTGILNDETCACDCLTGFFGANCDLIDTTQIQVLLDGGTTPQTLYDGGVTLDQLYGKMYKGGLLFYLNADDGTGMVAATEDQSTGAEWGCYGIDVPFLNNVPWNEATPEGRGAEIGYGKSNTDRIMMENCMSDDGADIAAKLCRDKGEEWFLPSIKELVLMNTNLHENGYGGFSTVFYWSSTELDNYGSTKFGAWVADFNEQGFQHKSSKNNNAHVRAARAF